MAPNNSSDSDMIGVMLEEFARFLASKFKTFNVQYLSLF